MTPTSETPPTLTFQLDWASAEERAVIMEDMRRHGRQTMNLRIMKGARLLRLRAPDDGDRIVGWAGLDASHTPGVAETFSLFVVPEYRSFLVGLILETARCAYLLRECPDVKRVLTRMESGSNTSLLRYRLAAGLMSAAPREEVGADTVKLCRQCELFGNSCSEQAYLWVDLKRFLARGNDRLGFEVTTADLPKLIKLDPARIRKSLRPLAMAPSERPKARSLSTAPMASVE